MNQTLPYNHKTSTPHKHFHLEILSHKPAQNHAHTPSSPPLLFVHGACAGAWCWDEHFLPFFAQHGFASYAVSLRGHGASEGREHLNTFSIMDYVDDVARAVEIVEAEHGAAPVLIGHSMGGLVIQKYLERLTSRACAGVLMASCPTTGIFGSWLYWHLQAPLLASAFDSFWQRHHRQRSVMTHTWVFSPSTDAATVDYYSRKFIIESWQAFLDMAVLLPNPKKITVPMMVMGAANDAIFPVYEVENTARAYGVQATIIPNIAHGMMIEQNWLDPAQHLLSWLQSFVAI